MAKAARGSGGYRLEGSPWGMMTTMPALPPGEVLLIPAVAQWCMIVLFLLVLVGIPVLWFVVGRDTYGTGDYYQP